MNTDYMINDDHGIDIDDFDMEEELKLFEGFTPKPVTILVRLYIPPIKKGSLYVLNDKSVYKEIAGYVARIGSCCFTGDTYKDWGKWYDVGDWVAIPRHSGVRWRYKGIPVFSISDDAPLGKIVDPREVDYS